MAPGRANGLYVVVVGEDSSPSKLGSPFSRCALASHAQSIYVSVTVIVRGCLRVLGRLITGGLAVVLRVLSAQPRNCVPRWLPTPHGWRGFLRHRHGVCRSAWMTSTRITENSPDALTDRCTCVRGTQRGGSSRRGDTANPPRTRETVRAQGYRHSAYREPSPTEEWDQAGSTRW